MMIATTQRRAGTLLAAAAALAFLAGLGAASGAGGSEVIDRQDVRSLRERVVRKAIARDIAVESAKTQLRREGLNEARVQRIATAIRRRLSALTGKYVDSLHGVRLASIEDAQEAIDRRERVLCYDASAWPVGFGDGRPLAFVFSQDDAEAFLAIVDAMILDAEPPLRDTARDLVSDGRISATDSAQLRDFSRMHAKARARTVIEEIRGAPFFSKADARLYVETAIAEELDRIRSELREPVTRGRVLDDARSLGAGGSQP